MSGLIIPLVLIGLLLLFGAVFLLITSKPKKDVNDGNTVSNLDSLKDSMKKDKKREVQKGMKKEDIFEFMEFDKVMDDMIVQQNGTKFTMAIKCKGINYDLMSEVEQLGVEEGFITFLNTLRYPIQLYVQAQNVDLKKNIKLYNDRLAVLREEYDNVNDHYSELINSLDATDKEIKESEINKEKVQNVLEYANDIVKYVEKISVNKNLLQRSFYVLVSYFSAEITSIDKFSKEEIYDICYSELYTRAQGIISALSACSVSGKVLTSNELAELLYVSYNRDDKNIINIDQALESGFYRLYTTSEDAFTKKNKMLEEYIKQEAELKALEAIKNALKDGKYAPKEMVDQEIKENITKEAINYVRNEKLDENVKENAKKILVEEYREEKKKMDEKKIKDEKADTENEQKSDDLIIGNNADVGGQNV